MPCGEVLLRSHMKISWTLFKKSKQRRKCPCNIMRNKYNKDYIPLEINLSLYLGKLSNVSSSHLKPVQNVLSIRGAL